MFLGCLITLGPVLEDPGLLRATYIEGGGITFLRITQPDLNPELCRVAQNRIKSNEVPAC